MRTKFQRKGQRRKGAKMGTCVSLASWRLVLAFKKGVWHDENEIARIIVDAVIVVHRELGGPGLLEDVYEEALAEELRLRGLKVERHFRFGLPTKAVSSANRFGST